MIESPDKELMSLLAEVTDAVNKLWKDANLPKFIQFGRDGQGAHSHALNGPAAKAVLRHKDLLINTIDAMQPVYALYEVDRYALGQKLVKVQVRVGKPGVADNANQSGKGVGGKTTKVLKQKRKKVRGAEFGAVGTSTERTEEVQGRLEVVGA